MFSFSRATVEKNCFSCCWHDAQGLIYVSSRMEHEKIIIAIIYAHCVLACNEDSF